MIAVNCSGSGSLQVSLDRPPRFSIFPTTEYDIDLLLSLKLCSQQHTVFFLKSLSLENCLFCFSCDSCQQFPFKISPLSRMDACRESIAYKVLLKLATVEALRNQNQNQNSFFCPENRDISVSQQPEDSNITISTNNNSGYGGIEVTHSVSNACANP